MTRRLAGILLAFIAATAWLAGPGGVAEVRAAAPDLTIVTNARYDVQPAQHRVRVTLDMVLTNHLKDTATKRFYFDRAFLSVLPATSGFKVTWSGGGTPRVKVSKKTSTYTLLQLDLAQRLYSGKSATYRLVFDLVDPGGAAVRDVRVGSSLVSFPVWAYATDSTPGSTVRVVFPAGYKVEVGSGDIPAPTTGSDGTVTLQTGKLDTPLKFFAYLVADRPGAYDDRTVTTTVGDQPVDLVVQSWPDDADWSKRVGDLMGKGLPVLSTLIGSPWPRGADGLTVREAVSRTTGGYAGLFDPGEGSMEVAYYADDFVVLHESAHAWFNGALLTDRWADEAFASYYGLEAARKLGVDATGDELTPELKAARIPLNAWDAVGREDDKTEDYAYAASLELAKAIAAKAGPDGLKAVWADAHARVGAYQPTTGDGTTGATGAGGTTAETGIPSATGAASSSGTTGAGGTTGATRASAASDPPPETVDGPPDWRGLLDLLEAHSSASFDELWRTWVARDSDLRLLDARKAARVEYDATVDAAGDWQLPRSIRDAMRAWRFEQATDLLDKAKAVLDDRAAIAARAGAAGLVAPPTLETAFEASDGFATAMAEADGEMAAIARYDAALAARPAELGPFAAVGLIGVVPDADLDRARSLFAAGDLAGSAAAADAAIATWTGAEEIGRSRALGAGAVALAVLLALLVAGALLLGRRRRRRALVAAGGPYATLAATPDPDPIEPIEQIEQVPDGGSDAGGEGPD